MKYRLLIVVVILYLSIALSASAQTPSTLTPTASNSYVTAPDIYVRGGPGSFYLPVGRLVAGDVVLPLNRSANGFWVMIQYNRGYGWVRRDLARWIEDIDALPTLNETNLTPTALLTETPTPASTGVQVSAGAEGAFVRFGPGVNYPFLGAIVTGDIVEPVGRNVDGDWLLIRFRGGFGWIARSLVEGTFDFNRLPVLLPDALTPSATFTASMTPTFTATHTPSNTPTPTPTLIPTNTSLPATTAAPSDTATQLPPPTNTRTLSPTDVPTDTPTSTATQTPPPASTPTPIPTSTPAPTDTPTDVPTVTDTPQPTATATPTASDTHTATDTPAPTETNTPQPTDTPTATFTSEPTDAPTEVAAQVVVTETPLPTETLPPSATPTDMPTATASFTATNTPQPTETSTPSPTDTATNMPTVTPTSETALAVATSAPPTPSPVEPSAPESPQIPPEVVVGVALLVVVLGYVALYWRALTVGERYAEGFVIERCPVCQHGHLTVETRPARVLGIPRPQAIVRCDNCRSVLREVGRGRWRYAVDRAANLVLYNQLNGRVVTEDMLRTLEENAPREAPPVRPPARPPTFVDDEE